MMETNQGRPAQKMSFGDAVTNCLFNNYAGFSGRASRSEYWFWVLFTILASIVTGIIDGFAFGWELGDSTWVTDETEDLSSTFDNQKTFNLERLSTEDNKKTFNLERSFTEDKWKTFNSERSFTEDNIFTGNLSELKKSGFYYRCLTGTQASELLRDEEPGTFLVRDSCSHTSYFTMSFVNRSQTVQHLRIDYSIGKFSFHQTPRNKEVNSESIDSIHTSSSTVLGLLKLYQCTDESERKERGGNLSKTVLIRTLNNTGCL